MNSFINNVEIPSMKGKMLVQLTCEEFFDLMAQFAPGGLASSAAVAVSSARPHQVVGVTPLATELGCSASFLYAMKAKGVLSGAIISHIGKKAVFDVDKARRLADAYQTEQRNLRITK